MLIPASLPERDRVALWQADPVAFAADVLGVDLWALQRRIARALVTAPRVAVHSCHAAGKTFLAAVCVLWFLVTHPDAVVLTTASTQRQVRYVLWRTIQRLARRARRPLGGVLHETEIRLGDRWYGLGLATDSPERFQGFHAERLLVVVDEPGAIPAPVFAAIEGVLAAGDTRLLLIGNPTIPHGPFHDAFHADAEAYRTFRISAFDTPNFSAGPSARPYLVNPAWAEQRRRLWGEHSDLYRSRVLAEFPRAAADQVYPLTALDAALTDQRPAQGRTALGVDVARFGDDATAFTWIREGVVIRQEQRWGLPTTATAGRVLDALRDDPALAVAVDDTGVGGGVTDALREAGLEPLAVNFGASAGEAAFYANRGSELHARCAEALAAGRLRLWTGLPTREALSGQLTAMTYAFTADGRRRIEKRGPPGAARGASPDLADALALAWAACEEGSSGPGLW